MTKPNIESLETAFDHLLHMIFQERNPDLLEDLFTEDVSSIGTSTGEINIGRNDLIANLQRMWTQTNDRIKYDLNIIQSSMLTEHLGLIISRLKIYTLVENQPLNWQDVRSTTIFEWQDEKWRQKHTHLSLPDTYCEPGEAFPRTVLREQHEKLISILSAATRSCPEEHEAHSPTMQLDRFPMNHKKLISICSECKKVRDPSGFWRQLEEFLTTGWELTFSHSICPQCNDDFEDRFWNS